MMKMTEFDKPCRRGYFYVLLAAILWAISGSSSKFLFNSGISPFQLVQLRLTISVGILFFFLLFRSPLFFKISSKDIFYFIVLGIVGMASVQFAYLYAISQIKVAAAILLEYLAPIFIVLHSVLFIREKLNPANLIALSGAGLGCYLVVGAYNLDFLALIYKGIVAGIFAAIAFAWYSVHGEYGMRRYPPETVLFFAMFFAAIAWNILQPPFAAFMHPYSFIQWVWILYIAALGTLLPFGLYFQGINLIRSTRASITATIEPITAAIISYLFLNEILEPIQIVGGAMVISAVILLQLKHEQDDKAPDFIRTQQQNKKKTQ